MHLQSALLRRETQRRHVFVPGRPLGGGLLRGLLRTLDAAADCVLVADTPELVSSAAEDMQAGRQSTQPPRDPAPFNHH